MEGLAHARVLEALLSARLAAGSHGRPGSTGSNKSSPAVSPMKLHAATLPAPGTPAAAAAAAAEGEAPADASSGTAALVSGGHAIQAPSASPFAACAAADSAPTGTQDAAASADAASPEEPTAPSPASTPAAAGRASSLPVMAPPQSPTAAAATAAAATQLARRRSVGSAAVCPPPSYSLSGEAFCVLLASAGLEDEVKELLAEAKNWYKKKGGALPLQVTLLYHFVDAGCDQRGGCHVFAICRQCNLQPCVLCLLCLVNPSCRLVKVEMPSCVAD